MNLPTSTKAADSVDSPTDKAESPRPGVEIHSMWWRPDGTCSRCGSLLAGQKGLQGHLGGQACDAAVTERTLRAADWAPVGHFRRACEAMGAPVLYALGFVSDAKGAARRARILCWSRAAAVTLAPFYSALPRERDAMVRAVAEGDAAMLACAALYTLDGSKQPPRTIRTMPLRPLPPGTYWDTQLGRYVEPDDPEWDIQRSFRR
jgi:hypothetical protein